MTREKQKVTEPRACKSCGAAILWAITRTNKPMPVDAKPDKDGIFVLSIVGGEFGKLHVEKWWQPKHGKDATRNRYTSHFATCPNSAEHRRGGE